MKIYHSAKYLSDQLKRFSIKEIAAQNSVNPKTIQNIVCRLKLTKPQNRWTKEEIRILENNYPTNPKIYDIFPGRSKSSVYHKTHRLKLRRTQRTGKYTINENFFDKWTPQAAYIFGFFCSDGNVATSGTHCSLHIHKKDIELIKAIKKTMQSTHPIEITGNYLHFRIYNKRIARRLIEFGCIPRKSLVLRFPKLPEKYLKHFVRGYFDGDGSIHFNKPNVIKIRLLGGTYEFTRILQEKLFLQLKLRKHEIKKHHNIFLFEYYGNDARKFCSWIYSEKGNLFLRRKYERFVSHIDLRRLHGI